MITRRVIFGAIAVAILFITFLFIIGLILVFVALPKGVQDSTHMIEGTPVTIALDTYVDKWWLRSMSITVEMDMNGIDTCTGQVALIESGKCSSLPTREENGTEMDGALLYVYALAGSSINVTLPNNTEVRADLPNIWFTHTLEAYLKFFKQITSGGNEYICDRESSDATCFSGEANIGTTINFVVSRAGYISLIPTISNDQMPAFPSAYGIEYSFNIITYDREALEDHPRLTPWQFFTERSSVSFAVSRPFQFSRNNCAILEFNCKNLSFYTLAINNLQRRWDIPLLMALTYFVILCVLVVMALMVQLCYHFKNRNDHQDEEMN